MPNGAVIAFASLVLERDYLSILLLLDDFSGHRCSGDERAAVRHVLAIGEHQHVTERGGLARLNIEDIDINRIAFCDAKLPASSFNDSVTHKLSRGEKAAQNSTDGRVWQTESLFNEDYALDKC